MNKTAIAEKLYISACENGVIYTLYGVFGKSVNVKIPFGKKGCDTSIDELEFSVRAMNALKRAGLFTIGDVVDCIAADRLSQIRNLGVKTVSEIKTTILAFGYDKLTTYEKKQFFSDVLQLNCT